MWLHAARLPCAVAALRRLEFGAAEQQRESSLKFQTRCVATYPDCRGYALGSVEGRVAMEVFDPSQEGKYAFKASTRWCAGGRAGERCAARACTWL